MNTKKSLIWFYMLSKRLLFKVSFVILLCLIPVLVYVANNSMQDESGVLRIILCTEKENMGADDVIDFLTEKESIMLFEKSYDIESSLKALEQKKADAVWYFDKNLDERISLYASGETSKPFITVYEREDTIPLKLSREKLFGAIYNKFSYYIYRDFAYEEIVSREEVSEDTLKKYYDKRERKGDIVEIKNTSDVAVAQTQNYLSSPLRGLLSMLIMLCGFAGAMYFIKDRENGKFDWMMPFRRIVPAFAQCLAAVVLSAAAVFLAIYFAGIGGRFLHELVCMLLFVFSATGFCLCLAVTFGSSGKLGASIPAFVIVMMVLSPIFFNMKVLKPIRLMLPTHYYLYSVYDAKYILYSFVYIACVYGVAFMLNYILRNRDARGKFLS